MRRRCLLALTIMSCPAGWAATVQCIPTVTLAGPCPGQPTYNLGPIFLTEIGTESPPAIQLVSTLGTAGAGTDKTVIAGYLIINETDGSISDIVRFFNDAGQGFAQLYSDPSLISIPNGSLTLPAIEDSTKCQGDPASLPGCIEYEVASSPPDATHPNGNAGASYFIQSDDESGDAETPEPAALTLTLTGLIWLARWQLRRAKRTRV